MLRWTRLLCLPVIVTILLGGDTVGRDDDSPAKAKPANPGLAPKAPTFKVEKAPFKVDVTLKGVFESPSLTEVSVKPEVWSMAMGPLTVSKAAEAGTVVKQGDLILQLDREKIDKAIRDLEAEQQLADLAIRLTELDLPIAEKSAPLDLAAAEHAKTRTEEDLRKFLDIDKALAIESAEFSVRNSKNNLEYVEEELKQLQKMYRKDLTEETEEIILKRQRNAVENAKFGLKMTENRREQTLKVDLPRKEQDLKDAAAKANISWEKARTTAPLTLGQKRLALEKAKYERTRGAERLANLKKDRELFAVKSPADGVVYYGRCVQGQWPSATSLVSRLQRGGVIQPDEVVMTIVRLSPISVRASIDEKDRALVSPGMPCRVTPTAMPDMKLAGKIDRINRVPIGGTFEALVTLDSPPSEAIVPGMACTVRVQAYAAEGALAVPAAAVFEDDSDEGKHYVYVSTAKGPEKKSVTTGKRSGGRVEITSGLQAGDEVLLSKPSS